MIPLSPDRCAFGRHETFPLRFGWITKGYQAWSENSNVFEDEEATVRLGVGKNMVSAMKYWLIATQVVQPERQSIKASVLGESIFAVDGWDPYLEDDATIWLLHWLIASNAAEATTPFWFFNRFHKPEFTTKELLDALQYFVSENLSARVSEATLKHDVALLVRMYQPTLSSKSVPLEEGLDSPVAMLGLMEVAPGSKYHESKPEFRAVPVAIFAFAVATGSPEPLGRRLIQTLNRAAQRYFGSRRGRNLSVLALLEEAAEETTPSTSQILALVAELQKVIAKAGGAGLLIVIDELGKFLEYEARHRSSSEIFLLQALAEHALRADHAPLQLVVLLHQSFEQYAQTLSSFAMGRRRR